MNEGIYAQMGLPQSVADAMYQANQSYAAQNGGQYINQGAWTGALQNAINQYDQSNAYGSQQNIPPTSSSTGGTMQGQNIPPTSLSTGGTMQGQNIPPHVIQDGRHDAGLESVNGFEYSGQHSRWRRHHDREHRVG